MSFKLLWLLAPHLKFLQYALSFENNEKNSEIIQIVSKGMKVFAVSLLT